MEVEKALVNYIVHTNFDNISNGPLDTIRNMVLTVLGTTVAGARAEGLDCSSTKLELEACIAALHPNGRFLNSGFRSL